MDKSDGRIEMAGFMDSVQAGDLLSGCGVLVWNSLFVVSSLLGIIGIGILILWSLFTDIWFGDGP